VLHAGLGGGVDECAVLLDAVGPLGRGHHEEGVDSAEGIDGVWAAIAGGSNLGTVEVGGAGGVAHKQAQVCSGVVKTTSDTASDPAEGAGDGDYGHEGSFSGQGRDQSTARARPKPLRHRGAGCGHQRHELARDHGHPVGVLM
jgi:hypothetical protein